MPSLVAAISRFTTVLRIFDRFRKAILLVLCIDQSAGSETWYDWPFLARCDYLRRSLGQGQWVILSGTFDIAVLGQLDFLVVGCGGAGLVLRLS